MVLCFLTIIYVVIIAYLSKNVKARVWLRLT